MPSESPGLLDELKTSNDLYQCVGDICIRFERPAVNNVDARFQAANRIKSQIDLNPEPGPDLPYRRNPQHLRHPRPRQKPSGLPDNRLPLHWPEVTVLGAILYCRGYLNYAAGAWNDEVTDAVKEFQRDSDLASDGCVGPATWSKLLSMGKGVIPMQIQALSFEQLVGTVAVILLLVGVYNTIMSAIKKRQRGEAAESSP